MKRDRPIDCRPRETVVHRADASKTAEPGPRAPSTAAISTFFVLAFVWSWGIGIGAQYVSAQSPALGTVLAIVSGFGPSLAAIALVLHYGGGAGLHEWVEQRLKWRHIGWRWYTLAFGLPPATMFLALAMDCALGGTIAASPASGHMGLAIANFGLVLLIGGPLGEELGWRGFALPAIAARSKWQTASLLVGVMWALWHLPLFFTADSPQSQMPILWFVVSTIAQSVILGWLFTKTQGSVVPALVMHTSINAWLNIIPVLPSQDTSRPFALMVGVQVFIAMVLLFKPDRQPPSAAVRSTSPGNR